MTPEQKLAMDQAEALAEAEAAAQAEANAAAGVTNEETGQDASQFGALKEGVRATGEGIASLADLPAQAIMGVKNIPARLTNTSGAAAAALAPGVDPTDFGQPTPGPEGWNNPPPVPVQLSSADALANQGYNTLLPPDPEHPTARAVGNALGPAIVEAGFTGGGSLLTIPGALRAGRRALATTGGTLVGGKSGELIDKSLGGTGEIGSLVGSTFGGGVAPGLTTQAGWKTLSRSFTDAKSRGRVAVVDRINRLLPPDKQIPLSAGLIGNQLAGQLEALTTTPAFGGGPVYRAREAQQLGLDTAAQKIAENIRGGPSAPEGITPSSIGEGVRTTATAADAAAAAKQEATYGPMKAQVGPETVLPDPSVLRDTLKQQAAAATEGVDLNTPTYFGNLVDVNAARPLPGGAPKVADPTLEASLQAQLARAQANLASAKPGSPLHTAASQSVADLTDAINANRGPSFQDLIKLRTVSSNRLNPATDFEKTSLLDTKAALTEAQKATAASKGVSPAEFDRVNAEYRRLAEQRDVFDPLKETTQDEAYTRMFSGTREQNLDRLRALQEHAPDQLRRVLVDQFERKMRGEGAGLAPDPESIAPTMKTGAKWWSTLPGETRAAVTGGGLNAVDAGALAALMRADARRPARTLPGQGGSVTGSNIFKLATPSVGGSIGGFFGGIPGALAGVFGPSVVANLVGRGLTSPWATRRTVAARNQPWLNDKNPLARILAAASGNFGPTNYRPSPLDEEGAH